MQKIEPPQPGIYRNVPAETYHAWDAVSCSLLKQLRKSPAHALYHMTKPDDETTEALTAGTAIHDAILLADRFATRYVRKPDGMTFTTKDGKAWRDSQSKELTILTGDQYDAATGIAATIRANPKIAPLFASEKNHEVSIVWNDHLTGMICKGRIDTFTGFGGASTHIDIKTTTNAAPFAFRSDIVKYGYFLQAAMYLRGCATLASDIKRRFIFLAVEKEPPYAHALYEIAESDLYKGENELDALLTTLKQCRETNTWPGYPDEVQTLDLPAWAFEHQPEEVMS